MGGPGRVRRLCGTELQVDSIGGRLLFLSGLPAVYTIATLLSGSPLRNVDSIGEPTPVVTGSSTAVVYHVGLHHKRVLPEKNCYCQLNLTFDKWWQS